MAEQSQIIVTDKQGVNVVGFGEPHLLDAYHINETAKELYHLIEQQGLKWLVLNVASIRMLCSQALGVFLNMRQKLQMVNGKMVISGIDPSLSRVFKITKLQSVFEFYENTDAAVTALADIMVQTAKATGAADVASGGAIINGASDKPAKGVDNTNKK